MDPKTRAHARRRSVAGAARAAATIALVAVRRLLPRSVAVRIAGCAGDIAARLLRERRRTVLRNLAAIAPRASDDERERLCRATFRNFAVCLTDVLSLPRLDLPAILGLVEPYGLEHLDEARAAARGVVIVTPHLGNWDLAGAGVAALGLPVTAVVEQLDPRLDRLLARLRSATGLRILPLGGARAEVRQALARNEIVALVSDRAIGKAGIAVPFSGGVREVPTGPAKLARSAQAPVVLGYVALAAPGAPKPYLAMLETIASASDTAALTTEALTRRIASGLARAVERHPDQWFVFQPKWLPADPAGGQAAPGGSANV